MTPGPANPISARGSAMMTSPSIAKLAVTPPVVGSVRTEMYGSFARSSPATAPLMLAICTSATAPQGPRDLLPNHPAHAAANEAVLHRGHRGFDPADASGRADHGVLEAGGG